MGLVMLVYQGSSFFAFQECFENSQQAEYKSQATEGTRVQSRLTEYSIDAHVPILGNIAHVGSFFIEEEVRWNGDILEKVFRIFGNSKPELARKGKDYSGELMSVKRIRVDDQDDDGHLQNEEWPEDESSSTGYFKKNGVVESESIVFYRDHAVSTRESGDEKRIEGDFGSLLSAVRYFLEHEIKAGDIHESAFILGGHPFIFRCGVGQPTIHESSRAPVFPIDFTTYDCLEKDRRRRPKVAKNRGGIRVWLSKEGPFQDTYLRLKIRYRWYLTLRMEYVKASLAFPGTAVAKWRTEFVVISSIV